MPGPRLHAVNTWHHDEQARRRLPLTPWVWIVLWVSCSSGFINGFANASGLLAFMSLPFLQQFFPEETAQAAHHQLHPQHTFKDQYCFFGDPGMAFYASVRYLAALITVPTAAWVTTVYGRKAGVGVGTVVFVLGTSVMASAFIKAQLFAGTIIVGISQAFLHMSMAIEIVEIAPPMHRGAFGGATSASYAAGMTCGIVIFLAPHVRNLEYGWRISYALGGWMGLIMLALLYWLPESPSSLVQRGKLTEARDALKAIRGELYSSAAVEEELLEIYCGAGGNDSIQQNSTALVKQLRLMFDRSHLPVVLMMALICLLKEVVGPLTTAHALPLLLNVSVANTYLLITFLMSASCTAGSVVGLYMSDSQRFGRRGTLMLGGAGCALCDLVITVLLAIFDRHVLTHRSFLNKLLPVFMVFGAFGGLPQVLYAVVMPENIPLSIRCVGVGACLSVYYMTRMLVQFTVGLVLCRTEWGFFLLLGGAHLGIVLSAWLIPEARGVPLDRVRTLWQKHPLFGRWVTDDSSGQ